MDWLVFWVAAGMMVEGTRLVLKKFCIPLPEKDKGLAQPLVYSQEWVDSLVSTRCMLPCCATKWDESPLAEHVDTTSPEKLEEQRLAEIAGKVEEDLAVPTIVTGFDGRRWMKTKGKEVVEVVEVPKVVESVNRREDNQIRSPVLVRSKDKPSRLRKEKSSTKIHPEPLESLPAASDYQFMLSEKSMSKLGPVGLEESGNPNDHKLPTFSEGPSHVAQ